MSKEIKGRLKIRNSLWLLIKAGIKTREFRKESKGLESGYYELERIVGKDVYGTVYLTKGELNPKVIQVARCPSRGCEAKIECNCGIPVDKETYNFVIGNYSNKKVNFREFIISEVEAYDE